MQTSSCIPYCISTARLVPLPHIAPATAIGLEMPIDVKLSGARVRVGQDGRCRRSGVCVSSEVNLAVSPDFPAVPQSLQRKRDV